MSKRCSKCDTWKSNDEFHKHASRKDGLQPFCKQCNAAAVAEHTAEAGKGVARVYIMRCLRSGDQYVGSTTRSVLKRLWDHRTKAHAGATSNVYQCMQMFSANRDWEITELETINLAACDTDYLRQREQRWIDEINPSLNMISATRATA